MAHTDRTPRATTRAMSADTDHTWLFCESDAEVCGLRASHGALVEMAQTGAARAGAGTTGIPRRVQGAFECEQVERFHSQREERFFAELVSVGVVPPTMMT